MHFQPHDAAVIDMGDVDDLAFVDQPYDSEATDQLSRESTMYNQSSSYPSGGDLDGDTRQRRSKTPVDEWKEGMAESATSYVRIH